MSRTGQLFEKPRAKRRVIMRVIDAGMAGDGSDIAKFQCQRCRYTTEWLKIKSITEGKRGKPCPECNKPAEAQKLWDAMHSRLKV